MVYAKEKADNELTKHILLENKQLKELNLKREDLEKFNINIKLLLHDIYYIDSRLECGIRDIHLNSDLSDAYINCICKVYESAGWKVSFNRKILFVWIKLE